ncbi:MAG: copper amine oxidase N-terminal domain-containing protein [Oscillospiraceae bacterium]|nr:copper amine oxidase N-terminal domain-containing protein [Oscillospiraceae bacterium]
MRKNRDMLHGFVLGVLLVALVTAIPVTADATGARKATIDVVYNNIKLVIDGNEVTPRDANGKVVEPFVYNGTTYLPLRAISNALTGGAKPVSWDQSTYTVYIGERPVEPGKIVDMVDMKTYPANQQVFQAGQSFQLRQQTWTPFNVCNNFGGTFLLKGDYAELNGFLAVPDGGNMTLPELITLTISDADTGAVLFKGAPERMGEPIPVHADLTGVDRLSISLVGTYCKFYNVTLTTIPRG